MVGGGGGEGYLGTHCETDPKSGGGESRDRRSSGDHPIPLISGAMGLKGPALTLWPLKQDMKSLSQAKYR